MADFLSSKCARVRLNGLLVQEPQEGCGAHLLTVGGNGLLAKPNGHPVVLVRDFCPYERIVVIVRTIFALELDKREHQQCILEVQLIAYL